ncbi:MAG TPA: hypothetical protein VK430_08025 [Xanthobacteraceae bacterium]|nr:hypothetical protein [Xanthobacteraceae bacterium]
MILAPLLGTALIVAVSTEPPINGNVEVNFPAQQKVAATEPLVRSATECIVRAVVADPRYAAKPAAALGDLIVDSMPTCVAPVRAMIDGFDRYYGDGAGEAFFMGPYLDVLPKAVTEGAKKAAQ